MCWELWDKISFYPMLVPSIRLLEWFVQWSVVQSMHLQCLKQCLAHGRYSVNTYWKNEWLTLTINEKIEYSENLSHFPQAVLTVRDKTSGYVFLKLKFCPVHHILSLWCPGYVNQDFFASEKPGFNNLCLVLGALSTTSRPHPFVILYSSTYWKFFTHQNLGRR